MTLNFIIRALLSGIIIAAIALIAKRNPAAGALVASLPLISIMGMLWLWHDTHDPKLMADHVSATLWYILPSLPMFALMPYLLRQGAGFWLSLCASIGLTIILYGFTVLVAARYGVKL